MSATTGREGCAELDAERRRQPPADAAAPERVERPRFVRRQQLANACAGRDGLLDDDRVVRHGVDHRRDEGERRDGRATGLRCRLLAKATTASLHRGPALRGPGLRVLASGRREAHPERLGEVRERGLGVAEDSHLRRVVLPDLPRVHVEMDHRKSFGHRLDVGREREREEIATHREEQVVLHQDRTDRGTQTRERSLVERVGEGEGARGRHAFRVDGSADELGDLGQLRERVAVGNRVAGDHDGPLGVGEQLGRRVDGRLVAADTRRDARRLEQVQRALGVEDVHGQGDEDGTGGMSNAVFTARRTARGKSSSRVISYDHFTYGRATGGRSDQRMGSVRFMA